MGYAFWIIYPPALFFGSTVTGYLVKPAKITIIWNHIGAPPGLYLSVPYFLGLLGVPILSLFIIIAPGLDLSFSLAGLLAGKRIRGTARL